MSNYLKTKEVLKDLDIEIFKLFDLCKKGELQAYNEYGKRVIDPDLCEKGKKDSIDEILHLVRLEEGTKSTGTVIGPGPIYVEKEPLLTREEQETKARERYNAQPDIPIIPEDCVGFDFILPARPSKYQIPQRFREIREQKIKEAETFLFKKIDIEKRKTEERLRFEKECGSDKPEDENITKISFYKNGQIWKIGTPGKEEDFTHLNGYEMIHFLLGLETKSLDATVVYNLGKCSTNSSDDEQVSKSVTDYMQGETKQPMIDKKTRDTCKKEIENLKEKTKTTTDPEDALECKEKIEKLEKYLADASNKTKSGDFRTRNRENSRINVQKRIKEALEVIYESAPYLKEFLNRETIHTGGKCCYKPDPSHSVQWVLNPPD